MMQMMLKPVVFTTIGLSVLMSAACSSGSDSATSTTSATVPSAMSSGPGTAREATNLSVTEELRSLLGDVYHQATKREPADEARRDKVIGPEHVFYGKIAGSDPSQDVFYAMGETGYTDDPVSRQDGPHVWRKRGSGAWEYLGDTGGDFCGKIPQQLVRVWGKPCP